MSAKVSLAQRAEAMAAKGQNLVAVDIDNLEMADIPGPTYAVEPLLPYGVVTLLGAHGGAGKSVLALAIAAHYAAGESWGELHTGQGLAVFISLEDAGDLVRFRLRRICRAYGLDMADVSRALMIYDGTGGETALAGEVYVEGVRKLHQTATLEELRQAVQGAGLIVIDNASDAFDGDENARRQVRAFVRMLGAIARENCAAVLLLAHIDKNAARNGANGNSYSGSTQWHNSARSRLALVHGGEGKGIELHHEKLNVGKTLPAIPMRWHELGVLMPAATDRTDPAQADAAAQASEAEILAVFEAAAQAGVVVPTSRTGPANTMVVLATLGLPQWVKGRDGRDRFWQVINRLQQKGRIEAETYPGANRHTREKFVLRQLRQLRQSPHTPQRTSAVELAQSALVASVPSEAGTSATSATDADEVAA